MANMCPCTLGNAVAGALFNMRNAKKLNEVGPEQTGAATVISRKVGTSYNLMKSDSSWAYLVTFRLENGEELELKASETDYGRLKEGTQIQLTWQDDQVVSFG